MVRHTWWEMVDVEAWTLEYTWNVEGNSTRPSRPTQLNVRKTSTLLTPGYTKRVSVPRPIGVSTLLLCLEKG